MSISLGCVVKPTVVISSLDADFSLSLRHILEAEGFATDLAMSPAETAAAIRDKMPVGLIVDGRSAFAIDLCRALKEDAATDHVRIVTLVPVEAEHRFEAFLRAGVDEAFMRPIAPDRYLRALNRLLGTEARQMPQQERREVLHHDGLSIDARAHRIIYDARDIHVAPIEFALLHRMMSDPGRVFRRDELARLAWPNGVFVDPKTVNVHIARLRKALGPVMKTDIVRTVRGIGYGLEAGKD